MNRLADLIAYRSILPYASEIFGVYQPLLGWKSKRAVSRFSTGYRVDRMALVRQAVNRYKAEVSMATNEGTLQVHHIMPGHFAQAARDPLGSVLLRELARKIPPTATPSDWDRLTPELVQSLLNGPVRMAAEAAFPALWAEQERRAPAVAKKSAAQQMNDLLSHESGIAGMLLELKAQNAFADLHQIVHSGAASNLQIVLGPLGYQNPIDTMDPNKDLDRVGLSPVGIVHLFRQYFFELDTFLGTPVSHVWLSPGSTVELVEISTRKVIEERTQELSIQTSRKSEQTTGTQDDLSDAVKDENQSNTKFGASVSASESWIWGSATESASFEMGNTQKNARETVHKQMRQQSSTLSEEIKKNFKTTFKTISESTDISSKRYVLTNTTDHLINYAPAQDLGVAKMVHIGAPPETWGDPNPDATPMPQPIKGEPVSIKYTWPFDDDTTVIGFPAAGKFQVFPPKPEYVYDRHELLVVEGNAWPFVAKEWDISTLTTGPEARSAPSPRCWWAWRRVRVGLKPRTTIHSSRFR
jgi:hypothetical protein